MARRGGTEGERKGLVGNATTGIGSSRGVICLHVESRLTVVFRSNLRTEIGYRLQWRKGRWPFQIFSSSAEHNRPGVNRDVAFQLRFLRHPISLTLSLFLSL